MNKMKKTALWILTVLLVALAGYLFVYPYDYVIRFEVKAIPGTINQSIKLWNNTAGFPGIGVVQQDLYHLEQHVQAGESVHIYHWEIEPLDDNSSKVTVGIKDRDHSLKNKLWVPFTETDVERLGVENVTLFVNDLKEHLDLFSVQIEGEAELPSTFYAYMDLKTSQHGKAGGMMDTYLMLSEELIRNGVTLNGLPMILVNEWDREKDSLEYRFCFPIIRSEQLPKHPDIKYNRIFPKRALKATYNGNYITSDRAWYALLDYAEKEGLEVEETPVEVFFNNPNMGMDAVNWKAEIFMPLKEESKSD
jgi:effector-binding domain-containing protein